MGEEKNEAKRKNELLKSLLYRKKNREEIKDWIIKDIWNLFDAKEEKEKKRDYGN